MGIYIFLGIVALGVLILVDYIVASKFSELAYDKGYKNSTAFHMCFWLGIIGYLYVAAMPCLTTKTVAANEKGEKGGENEESEITETTCETVDVCDPEKEVVYVEAKTKMQRGSGYNCARFYKEAIDLLQTIGDYKDSVELIDKCNEHI